MILNLYQVYAARNAEVLTCHEIQLKEINTQPDWVEFDPLEIWQNVCDCIEGAVRNLVILDINPNDIVALAVTNQRETTILWNGETGKPLYNAIGKFAGNNVAWIAWYERIFYFQLGMIAAQAHC